MKCLLFPKSEISQFAHQISQTFTNLDTKLLEAVCCFYTSGVSGVAGQNA